MTSTQIGAGVDAGSGIALSGDAPPEVYENSLSGMGVTNTPQINQSPNDEANQDPNGDVTGYILPNANDIPSVGDIFSGSSWKNAWDTAFGQDPTSKALDDVLGKPKTASSSNSEITDLFLRAIVVITGFIFVAIGLSMFKASDVVNAAQNVASAPIKAVKKSLS